MLEIAKYRLSIIVLLDYISYNNNNLTNKELRGFAPIGIMEYWNYGPSEIERSFTG